ncbi:zinc finger CCCH domain-containing protein 10-like [Saccoglossus kowalevskii]|uniref:Zinc finger CCCH domain-containing protein 10-like n=1 Tax=Saccoglossus kowalevskii TaxID=10224 RepID=A0ABM0H0E9_SACKO|nr:PREDICTED: zinc finger CCCH domain-containing protein 10-like [Saccoglossus kowalevskii]
MSTDFTRDTVDSFDDRKGGQKGDDAICRDFLRNVCRRGNNCKYKHPDTSEAEKLGLKQKSHVFCHDFQNKECRRPNCKFIHCTRDEEEYYKSTGDMPARMDRMSPGVPGNDLPSDGDIPVCRDYLKGDCRRGMKCKFRHMSQGDYDFYMRARQRDSLPPPLPPPRSRLDDLYDPRRSFDDYEYDRMRKRSRTELDYGYEFARPRGHDYRELEDECMLLRRRVDELKKQVSDLTATNDVLLDQNARLRAKMRASPTPNERGQVSSYSQVIPSTHGVSQLSSVLTTAQSVLTPEQRQLIAQEMQPLVSIAQAITPAPPITSIAPAMTPVSLSQSLQQPLLSDPNSMVTYPIVSQSMRSMPQSSLSQ